MSGYSNGAHHAGGDAHSSEPARAPGGSYPPISEIVASANEYVNDRKIQGIGSLINDASRKLQAAKFRLDARKNLAAAYWEFLVAYQTTVDTIPGHHDFYDRVRQSRGPMHREYLLLQKDVQACESRFMAIKDIIANDNKRNGARHSSVSSSRPGSVSSLYPTGVELTPSSSRGSSLTRQDDELMLPEVPSSPRRKPAVHPKPQSLHGKALHAAAPTDDLAERFAKLRAPADSTGPTPNPSRDMSVRMPEPSDYQSSRPMGPRDMLPLGSNRHSMQPLNTDLATSMPREPSPTYSPARNLSLPESINPPRTSARSIVGTGGRSNSLASSISNHPPQATGDVDSYFPPQAPPPAQRKPSASRPAEDQIPVEQFYDYVKLYNVLVIDVRPREEFDAGHINVGSVMCIEPTILHGGCSAEQLQERLILSPDEEQAMFDRRDEYSVVVYHDRSTRSSGFLHNSRSTEQETVLKRLYDALCTYTDKPLQRSPVFLMGGIDAWTDLVGVDALRTSSTTTVVASKQEMPPRTIRRVTGATHGGKLTIERRRVREYAPIDPDEERKWLEEAREGRAEFVHDNEDGEVLPSPLYQSTEEFLRRFPAIEEPQSMTHAPRRPPPSQYGPPPVHEAPSRPAPAAPRMSYSGVHERQPAPQGRTAQLPVYVSPGRYGQIRLHKTGLLNFGVTCYMNSIVQCLSANSGLASIFLSGQYVKNLQKDNWKGTKGILSESFATLLSNLFKGDVSAVRPSTFRRFCGRFNSQWTLDMQQDAKEFLEFLLDHLHEDLNVTWNKPPLKPLTPAEELARERLPRPYVAYIEWQKYLHREFSLIGGLFAGQHASCLTCMHCGTTSTTYEAFWSISVEIPRDRPADLRDCLRSYCSSERLDKDDVWRCPRCKTNREAVKKITITRAPDTLVVHLKRFSASHGQRAQKVRTPIRFPLHGLDLQPFMEPGLSAEGEAVVRSQSRGEEVLSILREEERGSTRYDAYAVVWHLGGTLGSGHYVACCKVKGRAGEGDTWRMFNDDRVRDFDPERLGEAGGSGRLEESEKTYIVFYERVR
ncbi:cysteine proteinase [Sporormia fimetaria CBS 119925]|uniref:Cysteine proteinase n=1 Tax=Sporormia fimetaria CBS 119925 TaxID=1340428 RepID=A0A6A6V444_9PLEO|nr:cysteine proteinase [Sporormia fimetaria CBS 119925]